MEEKITFEFATRDDCLSKIVPRDLRGLVSERDFFITKTRELEKGLASMLFDFGLFDSDEERLQEFKRLRREARLILTPNAKVSEGENGK